jgi:hypothetical protein
MKNHDEEPKSFLKSFKEVKNGVVNYYQGEVDPLTGKWKGRVAILTSNYFKLVTMDETGAREIKTEDP